MKFAAALLFLFTISLVAACSRPLQPAVQYGVTQTKPDPDQYPNLGTLSCEPIGFTQLPEGDCIGTKAAHPAVVNGTCVCLNDTYLPIPNGSYRHHAKMGFTCVHLISLFEMTRAVRDAIAKAGISESEDDVRLNDLDARAVNRADLAILSKNLRYFDRSIRESTKRRGFTDSVRFIQDIMVAYFPNPQSCINASPERVSKDQIFAEYPAIP